MILTFIPLVPELKQYSIIVVLSYVGVYQASDVAGQRYSLN
jgi:hypothetical protein